VSHVLIIEDDRRARRVLMRILGDAGYPILEARDGRTALDLLRDRRPEVVVLSPMAPGASVREVLVARMSDPALAGVAVVVTSGRPEDVEGVDILLKKPFTTDDLLAALARCRERAHASATRAARVEEPRVDADGCR